jgi:hypothetical protein
MGRSKYGAVPTLSHGIRFHSKREAARYHELLLLARAGEIWDLELQPVFMLCVPSTTGTVSGGLRDLAGTFNGRIGVYRADFRYWDRSGCVVEDVKGVATPLYKWKKKHVEAQYGITVQEIRYR